MKKDNKFSITMPELQKLIKEEYASMAKKAERAEEIQARLKAINEELETLPETETLSEVEASGTKKVKSTGWTGDGEGDVKYGEKFEKIGTHLKEDEEVEGEIELGGDEEMEEGPEMGYFEMKFAELGKELDAKMEGGMDESFAESVAEEGVNEMIADESIAQETVAEMEETKHEPIEGEKVNPEALAEEAVEEGAEVVAEEAVEEAVEVVAEEVVEESIAEEGLEESVAEESVEEMVNEDLAEPIEGETPAQDSEARFNDYMEKDKHVHESVKKGTTLLSEGFTPERKTALDSELERMKKLAKI